MFGNQTNENIIFNFNYIENNFKWLVKQLKHLAEINIFDSRGIYDAPGQI